MRSILLLIYLVLFSLASIQAQNLGFERDRYRGILTQIKDDVKKNYYDPNLKGIDIDAKFKSADEKIQQAVAPGQMSAIIAQVLIDFDDSHLFFIPPGKANRTDYGFEMKMIGDKCFVVKIDQKSDAANKGLGVGDEIYSLEGFGPSRENFWKMEYYFYGLRPRPILKLVVLKPDGKELDLEIAAKISQGKKVLDATGDDINQIIRQDEDAYRRATKQFYYDKIPGLFIWKMPGFALEPAKVDDIVDKAKKSDMILDLRGNGGGRVDMLLRLVGNFFPEDIKVADEKKRKETKVVVAKSRKKDLFTGKLIVLIDSKSASASEVFSRVVQLEKRGVVIGDRSAGAVMESRQFGRESGLDVVFFYATSITVADLIMKDGKSLEKVGVTPDERLIPTAKDLAAGRDIVLARAAELLGFKMSAEEASKLFPSYKDNR